MTTRVDLLRERLTAALAPRELDVVDESHKHVGHEGARDGRGHFRVRVVADAFRGKPPLARHRMVYEAVGDLMQTDVHALAIEARAPEDAV
ncbi:MAG TPA: BolA family protein [Tahibacter sp.]|nr:BolA family protein [Tahibacter sp.]